MKIEDVINLELLLEHWAFRKLLPLCAVVSVLAALVIVFLVVPDEQEMGAVQRIFYFHVASATTSYVMIAFLLVGSAFYLLTRSGEWDLLAQSAAGVAFLFCSIVLVTGMIWGHSAWNTWWRWEPRLVSSLILWIILAAYLVLGRFSAGLPGQQNFLAVLGIVSAVFVPIVIFSIRLLNQNEQAHPQVIARQGLADPSFVWGLIVSLLALTIFALWLMCLKVVNRLLTNFETGLFHELNQLRWEAEHGNN